MNRVNALCAMNRIMMETFSRRTVEGLKGYTLFRLALPPFQSFLDINVEKEVEKDSMVIMRAAEVHLSGSKLDTGNIAGLLQYAREIDRTFLRRSTVLPIDIQIHYPDIEHYRQQRYELLAQMSCSILAQWRVDRSFRVVVNELFNESQFRSLLYEILRLYAMETRMLSRSVRFPHLLTLARDAVTQTIFNVMEQEAKALARSLAHGIYRRHTDLNTEQMTRA